MRSGDISLVGTALKTGTSSRASKKGASSRASTLKGDNLYYNTTVKP